MARRRRRVAKQPWRNYVSRKAWERAEPGAACLYRSRRRRKKNPRADITTFLIGATLVLGILYLAKKYASSPSLPAGG